ncbi:transcription termination protein NusA [Gracilibacillus boraciitolerans JCM 21714]|uniref:Transcription termination protein NusA n=1 Tax=Gracilibacillus boraciitolerans JCM 21714 TaxID=1298598 RepID=W4VDU5_9BACI|nr:transcription termination protein NusA [Gracilibacillus boraciitolerans JCM 21714]
MNKELFEAMNYLEKEKGIDKNVLMEALEAASFPPIRKILNLLQM